MGFLDEYLENRKAKRYYGDLITVSLTMRGLVTGCNEVELEKLGSAHKRNIESFIDELKKHLKK